MPDDIRGLTLTAANAEAAAAFDHAVTGYLGMAVDTGERLKGIFAADPGMPMADVLKGYFFMLMAVPALKKKAEGILTGLGERLSAATAREQQHAKAMDAWAHGRTDEALVLWETILLEFPRDVLALRLAHHGYFYRGDSQNLRDVVARVIHAWEEDVPGYGFVMGMRAFGLEETHAYESAIDAGKTAVGHVAENPWAIHAVAHVYEMTDRPDDGLSWIAENEPGWTAANNFRYHVWWHRALMHLDLGEVDAVLALYDEALWDPASDEYLDLCNDASLLLRLELHDVDVGDRWGALAEKCRGRISDHILTFIDAHFALAMAAVGGPVAAEAVESQRSYADAATEDDNGVISRDVGRPLAEALVAYKHGEFGRAVDLISPIRYALPKIGGSHAQRDLFAMVLLDAAIRDGRTNLAKSLAAERLCRMPDNQWTRKAHGRAFSAA